MSSGHTENELYYDLAADTAGDYLQSRIDDLAEVLYSQLADTGSITVPAGATQDMVDEALALAKEWLVQDGEWNDGPRD